MSTTSPRGFVAAIALCGALLAPSRAHAQNQRESEPNDTAATADALNNNPVKVTGYVYPGADVDYFAFTVPAPCRAYCATMIANSASAADTILTLLAPDGVTVLEADDNDGSFNSSASSIAGVQLPGAGTYFVRVTGSSPVSQIRPYDLYLRVHSAAPAVEVEPNDMLPGQPMRSAGLVAGVIAGPADIDLFRLALNSGDTVFASLDLDPERDGVELAGALSMRPATGIVLTANDPGGAGPDSEALFWTVNAAGNYDIGVSPTGAAGGTYHLSVSVLPSTPCAGNSITASNNNAVPIIDAAVTSSVILVPGNPRVGRVRVAINLTHASMNDLDIELLSPAGGAVSLFSDVGSAAQTQMNLVLDDEAAIPIAFNSDTSGLRYQPESTSPGGRLDFFHGIGGGSAWTLIIRDDLVGGGAGTLNSWSIEICDDPLDVCPPGSTSTTIYSSSFEADDGGFTHGGVQDEWQRGTPTLAPLNGAYSGVTCWKTDLAGTYNLNCSQELVSPVINLAGQSGPIRLRWAQRLHIESASFDHAWVEVKNPGGANVRRVWEWLGPSMNVSVGTLPVTVAQSIGWSHMETDITAYAGQSIQVVFHLDSDNAVNYGGFAVDDVRVVACDFPCPADITGNGSVNTDDLILLVGAWGTCVGCPGVHCPADIAPPPGGDCQINTDDLILLIVSWGQCP